VTLTYRQISPAPKLAKYTDMRLNIDLPKPDDFGVLMSTKIAEDLICRALVFIVGFSIM
jgi:hypothetical protein